MWLSVNRGNTTLRWIKGGEIWREIPKSGGGSYIMRMGR